MSKLNPKPGRAETQHMSHNRELINSIMTIPMLGWLKDELTELKGDMKSKNKIFKELKHVNTFVGRGPCYRAYLRLEDSIETFFRDDCTTKWYPNNAVKQPLDVSGYSSREGNLKLKTELKEVFALTSVKDNINAKYTSLEMYYLDKDYGDDMRGYGVVSGNDLHGFGVAKFRRWMNKNDQNDAPPDGARAVILSYMEDTRNPRNKDEEEYKQGRVTAMCFALLLTEELRKPRNHISGPIAILGAAMIHALTTHAEGSHPLWEHICDVIYPPNQHKEKTILFDYMAACTNPNSPFSVLDGFYQSSCSCGSGCECNKIDVRAEEALGLFVNNDVVESVRKWQTGHLTTSTK